MRAIFDAVRNYSASQLQAGRGSQGTQVNIAVALMVLKITVLRNSWRLLVELPSGQPCKARSLASYEKALQAPLMPGVANMVPQGKIVTEVKEA